MCEFGKLPDGSFETYLIDFSESNNDTLFNVSGVIRLKEKFLETFTEIEKSNQYFKVDHSGYCLIKERRKNQIKFKSVYGTNVKDH